MGNVLKAVHDFVWNTLGRVVVQDSDPVLEGQLLQELLALPEVELWRIHWCLSQDLLKDIPPIPPHWLASADACSIAKTMMRCYQEEGALMVLAAVLTLIGRDDRVCHIHHTINPFAPKSAPRPDPDLVRKHRGWLISRIQRPEAILDALRAYGILNTTNREAISMYGVRRDKNRALVDLVLRKGDEALEVFYMALSQSEPFLLQELDGNPFREKNASDTSVIAEMLAVLASDELRSFQWLLSDHTAGESHPPIGRDPLEHADRITTQRLLEQHCGSKQAESITRKLLRRTVPALRFCLPGEAVTSQTLTDVTVETEESPVEVTAEVHKKGSMFRLRRQQPGVFRCSLTGLLLAGFGDLLYEIVPWDVDFLSSRGLRPAGPLFRFTLLSGRFHELHLPHCQLLSDGGQHFLSVAHLTGDRVDFITAGQVTDSHVIIDIAGFSCFGLVTSAASTAAIRGLVLLFSQPSTSSIFVLLLPRNVCLTQVRREWKRRVGADYVEAIPDCELIPNQTYKLTGQPVTVIQPESSKFVNFSDYNNFLPSFQCQPAPQRPWM
ncbi:uncharacterized protein LOC114434793 isoform X2 [Parambassis ranga]|uniref:Uncharacterized protein LOC114434793 isoform X2 n=1 Tax=Parambassis ranga TaxID=210632 RepID=A0A6P7IAV1_9TELE|nr:uncharacterized protein LOC114434793 isoform X2 [Parambassis ranga]